MPVPAENMVSFCQMGASAVWGADGLCPEADGKELGLRDWMFRVGQEVTIATPPF